MLRDKVIPNDGTAHMLVTDIDTLSCHLCIGNRVHQYGWFEHPTRETLEAQFKVHTQGDYRPRDDGGWSQKRIDNHLLLQKVYTTPTEGVFTCLLSHDVHPATAHLSIHYPSEL